MSLFESSITGNVLNNGQTTETTGITAGQLSLVLTQYTPLETTAQNTANTSLTLGLASKANQSALDALQVEVDGKSTPASVDLKLANYPTTAGMNSSIASANNATLATTAATYALKSVVDQLALDVAARQTAGTWPRPSPLH